MAVLAPLPQQNISLPPAVASVPAIATSQYSGGGILAPTTTVATNFNTAPINYNSVSNPYFTAGMSPQVQQQQSNPITGLLSNASSAKSLGQFVSNGFSLPQSSTLNSLGAGSGLFGSGGLSYTTAGALPWQSAGSVANGAMAGLEGVGPSSGLLGSGTLSSTLGAAGIGAMAGSFLGRIGGNSTGGSIGGALGAGIGNLILPGIGGIVGGLIGGIGGGFFGNKSKPTSAWAEAYKLDDSGTWANYSSGGKNGDSVRGPVQEFNSKLTDSLTKAQNYLSPLGISLKDIALAGGINTEHKQYGLGTTGYLSVGDGVNNKYGAFGWEPGDAKSQQQAIFQALSASAKQAGATPEQVSEMIKTIFKEDSAGGIPLIPAKAAQQNTQWETFVNNYKASIAPPQQGNSNATTNTTTTTDTIPST